MKTHKFICIVLILILLSPILRVAAKTHQDWSYLDAVADQALQLTRTLEHEKASTLLRLFAEEFEKLAQQDEIPTKSIRVLTVSLDEAFEAINNEHLHHEQKYEKVLKFRLAVDAIHSMYEPLWIEMQQPVMSSFQNMKRSLQDENALQFQQQLQEFLNVLNIIYPSLVIDIAPEEMSELEAHITFLGRSSSSASSLQQQMTLEVLEHDLVHLFGRVHMPESDPSLIWVTTTMYSIIFLSLLYVGWRKYRAEMIK